MRKLISSFFISLDGVVESPDKWHFPYFNVDLGAAVGEAVAATDTLLLGTCARYSGARRARSRSRSTRPPHRSTARCSVHGRRSTTCFPSGATLRSLGDEGLRGLVERYVDAWESRNVDAMVSLLIEDATFAMPPAPVLVRRAGRCRCVPLAVHAGPAPRRHERGRAAGDRLVHPRRGTRRVPPRLDRGAHGGGRARDGDRRARRPRAVPAVRVAGGALRSAAGVERLADARGRATAKC